MKDILIKNNLLRPPKIGEIVEGRVIAKENASLFLDVDRIGTGIIYGREFHEAKDSIKNLKIGDTIFAKVVDVDNEEGYLELSLSGASKEIAWENLRKMKEDGNTITIKVMGANKGGLLSQVSGIAAFLPVSQLSSQNYPKVEGGESEKILRELQKFINREFEVKIFDLNPKEGKLILSEKAKEMEKTKEALINYKVGDVVEGEITGITDFGAFINFGENLDGLIHISELDWKIIEDPAEIVKTGEKVKVKIVEISDNKVCLSLKALKDDPWQNIEEKYKKGDVVSGKVTKFNPYGTFVQLNPEIQGLCHISQFESRLKMEEKLKIGKNYDFQILSIEPAEHRISLKLVE